MKQCKWQTLDTAPKEDGKKLIFADQWGRAMDVEWCEDGSDEDGNHWSGWVECGDGAALDRSFKPTHWTYPPGDQAEESA